MAIYCTGDVGVDDDFDADVDNVDDNGGNNDDAGGGDDVEETFG